jgi:pimeloyl-ACP methyl ester carboxylesterase
MADDAAVIQALGLKQVDVLGFSLGGFQAQDLVRRHPELVRKLMLLGTGPRGGKPRGDDPDVAALVLKHATSAVPSEDDLFLFLVDLQQQFKQVVIFGNVAISVRSRSQQVQTA